MVPDAVAEKTGPLQRQVEWLRQHRLDLRISERGSVISVGDGIVWLSGLPSAAMNDIVVFEEGSRAMVFDLTQDMVGAILLQETEDLTAGVIAHLAGQPLGIPVSDELAGRIVDPFGTPLDEGETMRRSHWQLLEVASPAITRRDFVHAPLYTGIKIIDTLIPVGKGQRQLLIGDEGLGRSSVAIDTVINQKDKNVQCVYALIGQKRTTVVNTIDLLRQHGALAYTTVVVAEGSSLPGLQYLAPFAACAIAEYWMQQGRDTLVIYDDLSTHASIYRELSLLLRRPPGREAYPGDIFSVHARLLERATCLNAVAGGGSLTALPIVETRQGEIASYIPTNLISITDGQIYLDRSLFTAGFRPAVDISRSVSRIGGQAQHNRIKEEAGRMKLDYMQYLELEVFTRFGARLEASMEAAIHRGRVLREILKQDRLTPLPIEFQMAWLVAFNDSYFDKVEPERVPALLDILRQRTQQSSLTLDDARDQWVQAVSSWLAPALAGSTS